MDAAGGVAADAGVRAARVVERLDALWEIGLAAGTNRPGLGAGEQQAFDLVAGWMRDAGLEVASDAAGNLYARLAGSEPELAEVWVGSHLDTPPDGGRFDGALGVLAALDALEALAERGGATRTVAAVAFRLEEGWRFGRGVFGSRAVCGQLEPDEGGLTDADGTTLADAFAGLGLGELPHGAAWLVPPPHAFLEAHIEQGPTLAAREATLGVVVSIAGMAGVELTFTGARGHAGTVPMALRRDALGAAAGFITRAHAAARAIPDAVATLGRLTVAPGATNTIPERVVAFADLRAPDDARVDALLAAVERAARETAAAAGCEVALAPRWRYAAVPLAEAPRAAVARGIEAAGLEPVELPSGAGHDAAILALAGVPCGMLFVRSDAGGISHAPGEHTGTDAIAAALPALEAAVAELAA